MESNPRNCSYKTLFDNPSVSQFLNTILVESD
jgi:hypothetical protein